MVVYGDMVAYFLGDCKGFVFWGEEEKGGGMVIGGEIVIGKYKTPL